MYRLIIEEQPSQEDMDVIFRGLTEHAVPYTDDREAFVGLTVLMKDKDGKLVGGATGKIIWNWLYVSHLWVEAKKRNHGFGKKIMDYLENNAREKGCKKAHLDTFSFQAKPFYESLGYKIFATLDDYPEGYKKYFMYKDL